MTYFSLLGLQASYEIDRDALDEAYYRLQLVVHPDKNALHAMHSAEVNKAYAVLCDPLQRADYLFHEITGADVWAYKLQDVAEETIQWYEDLETNDNKSLEALADRMGKESRQCIQSISEGFQKEPLQRESLAKAIQKLRYSDKIRRLAREKLLNQT